MAGRAELIQAYWLSESPVTGPGVIVTLGVISSSDPIQVSTCPPIPIPTPTMPMTPPATSTPPSPAALALARYVMVFTTLPVASHPPARILKDCLFRAPPCFRMPDVL